MRARLAGFMSVLAGCSFIYNPDHIKGQEDARGPDAEVITDVDPTMLKIDYAYPLVVEEGAGQGGARNALIVLHGAQILPSATVTVTPSSGPPTLIDVKNTTIAGDANWIAIELAVPVDPMRDETGANATADIPLSITVDNGNGTTVMVANPPAIHFYDQLTAPITAPVAAGKKYSKIDVTSAMPFTASGTTGRVELHAVSSIAFAGAITMSASSSTGYLPGPGGCQGSTTANAAGAQTSAGDGSPCKSANSASDGTGGNVGSTGGTVGIPSFAAATSGGGSGGGRAIAGLLGGGAGGGGGGMLWLSAGGDVSLASFTANGGAGANGGVGGGGGGGVGGTLLVQSGHAFSASGAVSVAGGSGGSGGSGTGMTGPAGVVRLDAASGTIANAYLGPTWKVASPVVFSDTIASDPAQFQLVGIAGDSASTGQVYDKDGVASNAGHFTVTFSANGTSAPNIVLTPGYNKVCSIVPAGNVVLHPEAGNCVEVAYLPGLH